MSEVTQKWTEPSVILTAVGMTVGLLGFGFTFAGSVAEIPEIKKSVEAVKDVNDQQTKDISGILIVLENLIKKQDEDRQDYKDDQNYLRQTLDRLEQKIDRQ